MILFKGDYILKKVTPASLKKALFNSIDHLLEDRNTHLKDPGKSFSRVQKISFRETMLFPITLSSESTSIELLDFFRKSKLPTQAAMSYRRDQVRTTAFADLFRDFTSVLPGRKTYRGMYLIACDGTRLNTPYNPEDSESFSNDIKNRKGFNQYHLNTCYDILNDRFTDAVIQGCHSMNENLAFREMMDRYPKERKSLFIADRGFFSYNSMAHAIRNGHSFIIRLTSRKGCNFFDTIPEGADSFDIEDDICIGRRRDIWTKGLPNYRLLHSKRNYDYIPAGGKAVDRFHVRVVKFILQSGEAEYLLTNLPKAEFSMNELMMLYSKRWGIETSYRYLKYTSGMVHIHSIKPDFIIQEIYARLIGYNFCAAVLGIGSMHSETDKKHLYVTEKTYTFKVCIRFLKEQLHNIKDICIKRKVPVRAGRRYDRNIRRQHADTLQYR